jgi:hypothetical protein
MLRFRVLQLAFQDSNLPRDRPKLQIFGSAEIWPLLNVRWAANRTRV